MILFLCSKPSKFTVLSKFTQGLTYLSKLMLDFPPRRKPSKVQTKQTAMKETKGKIKGVLGDYAMPQIETTVSIKSFHDLFILKSGC